VYLKNEGRSSQLDRDEQEEPGQNKRKNQAKRLGGLIACVPGILLGLGSIMGALLGATEDISAGVLAIVLGVLGYSLGARRLGTATVVLGTVALFVAAAASTGLIPGVAPMGHDYSG
jgi:hypothetical protein